MSWLEIKPRLGLRTGPDEPARLDDASYFGHFGPYPTWAQAKASYDRIRAQNR
jgi:hypothetical protein